MNTLARTIALLVLLAAGPLAAQQVAPAAPLTPSESLATQGANARTDMWRDIRSGLQGTVVQDDKRSGVMIQSEGENWRALRNGPVSVYGSWAVLGMVALLAVFFALRGRIRIDAGPAGTTIERFNGIERFAHWLTAGCFIVLALTGLNLLYGRYILPDMIGKPAFAAITFYGKIAHNYLAFGFMAGIALMFVLWVRHNLPSPHDLIWILKGGGILVKGVHPPAKKFNFGQKIIFWLVILGGGLVSYTGVALMFPFFFGDMADMQLVQVAHAVVALVLTSVVIAHIYIGSIGMEGAFDAMGTGKVDLNWAREHHNLWVAEVLGEKASKHGHD